MALPITTNESGICFAFPDICDTGTPPIRIPYPNIGDLTQAVNFSKDVLVGGYNVIHQYSEIPSTTGDDAANPPNIKRKVTFTKGSKSVFVNGKPVVRMFDTTSQNKGNATGFVLGGDPTVLVGD